MSKIRKMNKKLMLLVGCIVLLGIVAAVLIFTNKDQTRSNNKTNPNSKNLPTKASSGTETEVEGNLKTLASDGKPRTCTMSYEGSDGEGKGKLYTDGQGQGRIKIDLTTARGNTGESNTLINGSKVYSWTKTEGGAFGFVFDVDDVQTNSTGSPTTSNSQTAGKNFSMKCKPWNVDEALLSVPSDVNFSTLPSTP